MSVVYCEYYSETIAISNTVKYIRKNRALASTRFYVKVMPRSSACLGSLHRLYIYQKRVIDNPLANIETIKVFQSKAKETMDLYRSWRIDMKRFTTNIPVVPFSSRMYQTVNKLLEQADTISEIDVNKLVNEKEVVTLMDAKKKNASRLPLIINIGAYIIVIIAAILLSVLKVIPIFSGIIGCVLGISFLHTSISEYGSWRRENC